MNPKDICLIIGAGASKDICDSFGLGCQLVEEILKNTEPKTELYEFLISSVNIQAIDIKTFGNNLTAYKTQRGEIYSIDEFLNEVESFPEYNSWKYQYFKIAYTSILYSILNWENEVIKKLKVNENIFDNSWVKYVINFIEKNELLNAYDVNAIESKSSLQIVTFNYDRLLEYFLFQYANKINKQLLMQKWIENNVFHVYGKIEELHNHEFGLKLNLDFGKYNNLMCKSALLMTMFNHRDSYKQQMITKSNNLQNTSNSTAGDFIVRSNKAVGFGFAFDFYNSRYLGLLNGGSNNQLFANIFTKPKNGNFNERRSEIDRIRRMIPKVQLTFSTCNELMNEFLND